MTSKPGHKNRYIALLLWVVLISLFLIRFAEPVKDGDIFFHMKYGEYHIQHKTALADHSLFSWTPATKYVPYCTWAADIILYLIHQAGGMPLLFIFKYLCLLIPILIIGFFANKAIGHRGHLLTFFVLLIVLFDSTGAAYLKPEILSLVFFALVSLLYYSIKIDPTNRKKHFFILCYPILYIFWANMHGVFIFGLLFLAAITAGEIINFVTKQKHRLPKRSLTLLIASSVLSAASAFATPYGTDLIKDLLNLSKEGVATNVSENILAYKSLFDAVIYNPVEHHMEYWGIMVVLFVILFLANARKNHDWDFGILLPTILLACLHAKFIRSSYYWPTFWALSIFVIASKQRFDLLTEFKKMKRSVKYTIVICMACISVYITARGAYEAYFRPPNMFYFGFGLSYGLPLQESAFLKKYQVGKKMFNSYNMGSLLLFDHYPDRKVFIDPRYFPYQGYMFNRYIDFKDGGVTLEEMEAEFDFDIAVVGYADRTSTPFLISENWRPIFYGTAGYVLLRKDVQFDTDITTFDLHRFDNLKNPYQALKVIRAAHNLNDLEAAAHVIEIIKKNLSHISGSDKMYQYAVTSQKGLEAYEQGDFDMALKSLWKIGFVPLNIRTNTIILELIDWKSKRFVQEKSYQEALRLTTYVLKYYPNDANRTYNAGVIAYLAAKESGDGPNGSLTQLWRDLFEELLKIAPEHPKVHIVKRLLMGDKHDVQLSLI